jgi:hypothetical protein
MKNTKKFISAVLTLALRTRFITKHHMAGGGAWFLLLPRLSILSQTDRRERYLIGSYYVRLKLR